ncbi:hypothetical protein TWF225_008850 [Orbilia oligospora]|uniref:Uncharacterized protein n=1 Tax=Orbilia oligospora TaxID=2813651 RepID=A0A7C8P7V8_ORBOL|nr:hypothetical protein TWF751_007620 [Orbilia oligospora]KAF3175740.1 hypothetical protein TWF225_008850 [Orbilia oligospora]KAF3239130.1 hypothetical protein TWF128_011840 [Orbilia oligospora]KAF3246051.1 hypothetical protein TWF217_010031 [Orbilia oligospora]KAF3284383.1 hypothetical protein TWF132_009812 [Orbilia oligospora]
MRVWYPSVVKMPKLCAHMHAETACKGGSGNSGNQNNTVWCGILDANCPLEARRSPAAKPGPTSSLHSEICKPSNSRLPNSTKYTVPGSLGGALRHCVII